MPAYFNLSLEFERKDLYPHFVSDLFEILEQAGLEYLSGYWEAEGDSRDEIIRWNQKKLEQDFQLGFTEHHSHDYKQVLYSFGGYSEVRGFWMNQYPEKGCFTYEIIIPEEDVLEHEGGEILKKEHEKILIELAERIWEFPYVKAIQTGIEGDDASTGISEFEQGKAPNMYSFAVLEEKYEIEGVRGLAVRPFNGSREGWIYCRRPVGEAGK